MAHFLHALLNAWAGPAAAGRSRTSAFRREADALAAAVQCARLGRRMVLAREHRRRRADRVRGERRGRIFLNAQTWSVLSGLAPQERAVTAMASAREHLYQPYGALLFAPAFSVPNPAVGYLTRYAPGVRENGGVYVHAACWAVLAERKLGDAHGERAVDRAYRLWSSFNPARRGEEPDVYMGEPYVMPGNVEGPDSEHAGRGAWTWYTGSSGWYLRALVEGVLGVEARLDGLHVARDLPARWDGYRIVRPFRGARYAIRVRRALAGEAPGCTVNGEACARETLPILPGTVEVEIVVP
jgi:cellobiose phosphorylase